MDNEQGYEALRHRVEQAVAKEDRKRRRGIWLFLVLALIPLAVGGYVLVQGIDDTAWVRKTAEAAASSEIDSVRPTLRRLDEISTALPEIRTLAEQVPEQNRRIDAVERQQTDGLQRIEERVAGEMDAMRPALRQVEELQARLPRMEAAISRFDEQSTRLMLLEKDRSNSIKRLEQSMETLSSQLGARTPDRSIQPKFDKLEQQVRELQDRQAQASGSTVNQSDLDRISHQLASIQRALKTQSTDIAAIQARLDKLENSYSILRRIPRAPAVQ